MHERVIEESIIIDAAPEQIFDVLATPSRHQEIDGSTSIKGVLSGPDRLFLGAKFGMSMKLLLPYHITNEVVEFEENKCIAWRHFGKHVWRYVLREVEPKKTEVTEYFDYQHAVFPLALELMGAPTRNRIAMVDTLKNLKDRAEEK